MPSTVTLRRLSVLLTGLLAACDVVYLPRFNGRYRRLDAVEYARAHNSVTRTAGKVAPALALPLLLTDALLLAKAHGSRAPVLISLLLTALNAGITFAVNVPINKEFDAATEDSPLEDWEALRDRWAAAHNARTTVQILGFACALAGYAKRPSKRTEGR